MSNEKRFKSDVLAAIEADAEEVAEVLSGFLRKNRKKAAGFLIRMDRKRIAAAKDSEALISGQEKLLRDMLDFARENPKCGNPDGETDRLLRQLGFAEGVSLYDALRRVLRPKAYEEYVQQWQQQLSMAPERAEILENRKKELNEAGRLFLELLSENPDKSEKMSDSELLDAVFRDEAEEMAREKVPNEDRFKSDIFSAIEADMEEAAEDGREPFLCEFLRKNREQEASLLIRMDRKRIAAAADGDMLIFGRERLLRDMLELVRENPGCGEPGRETDRLLKLLGFTEGVSLQDALQEALQPGAYEEYVQKWQLRLSAAPERAGMLEDRKEELNEAGKLFLELLGVKPDKNKYTRLRAAYLDYQLHEKTPEELLETIGAVCKDKRILKNAKEPGNLERTVEKLAADILRGDAKEFLSNKIKRSNNSALDLVSSYCGHLGISVSAKPAEQFPGGRADIESEAFKREAREIYAGLKENAGQAGGVYLPLFIDARTGAGIFIVGKKYLPSSAYPGAKRLKREGITSDELKASSCHFCYMEGFDLYRTDVNAGKETGACLELTCSVWVCLRIEEAIERYKCSNGYGLYQEINGEPPEDTAEKFLPYFEEVQDAADRHF